uniref:RNA-binding protein BRN1 isoform X2 n=1 Tax=Rhizophora mucronata TaxID=61149 RepID=A0A2P2MV25_RHIMU
MPTKHTRAHEQFLWLPLWF